MNELSAECPFCDTPRSLSIGWAISTKDEWLMQERWTCNSCHTFEEVLHQTDGIGMQTWLAMKSAMQRGELDIIEIVE